jgi:RNA polymerase sigma-70 factor (ECF subfamily)
MTDEELVKITLKKQDYFKCIIERYDDKLLRYILRISSMSREDAEDVLQDVFISVYKNLNGFDRDLKFSSWVYRITYNRVVSTWRKSKNAPIIFKNEDSLELFKNIASEENILLELNNKDVQQETQQVLTGMKKEYAEVLVLKFLEDKSYKEISDILKKPMGTVATLINRAKKQFKEIVVRQK